MNEATFQTHLVAIIRQALPMLPADIVVEKKLTLRLGHQRIDLDGSRGAKDEGLAGRLDVLVSSGGKPLMLFELKAPGVESDASEQALSYARLIAPMPPLVVTSNGVTTHVYRTYDGHKLPSEGLSGGVETAVAHAARVASSDTESAIRTLLGSDDAVWMALSDEWTTRAKRELFGAPRTVARPIVDGFQIPRKVVARVNERLREGSRLIAITGGPMSGVTNTLVQVASSVEANAARLFVRAKDSPSVLQHLAARLNRALHFKTTKDDVRHWLQSAFRAGGSSLILVVDGSPSDLQELLDLTEGSRVAIVIGLGDNAFESLSVVEGRAEATSFGRNFVREKLSALDDSEFDNALGLMAQNFAVGFHHGVQCSPELRTPRMLRVALGLMCPNGAVTSHLLPSVLTMAAPLTDPPRLRAAWKTWAKGEVASDFDIFAKAYLEKGGRRSGDLDWVASTFGHPSITVDDGEQELGIERIARMRSQGFISLVEDDTLGARFVVRVRELFGYALARVLARAGRSNGWNVSTFLEHVRQVTRPLAAGAAVGAQAVLLRGEIDPAFLGASLKKLLSNAPTIKAVGEGQELVLLTTDGAINIKLGAGAREQLIGNTHDWLIASFMLAENLGSNDTKQSPSTVGILTIGAAPFCLLHVEPATLEATLPIPTHDLEGLGSAVCSRVGIVEPITQAILVHAERLPREFVELARRAVDEELVFLATRLTSVAHVLEDSCDDALRNAAIEANEVLLPFLSLHLTESACS